MGKQDKFGIKAEVIAEASVNLVTTEKKVGKEEIISNVGQETKETPDTSEVPNESTTDKEEVGDSPTEKTPDLPLTEEQKKIISDVAAPLKEFPTKEELSDSKQSEEKKGIELLINGEYTNIEEMKPHINAMLLYFQSLNDYNQKHEMAFDAQHQHKIDETIKSLKNLQALIYKLS